MDGRKVYLLLPLFIAFVFSAGISYADVDVVTEGGKVARVSTVDLAALKAELKREIKAELAAEKAPAPVAVPQDISSAVSKALEDNGVLGGLFKGVTASGFIDVNYLYNLRNHGEGSRFGPRPAGRPPRHKRAAPDRLPRHSRRLPAADRAGPGAGDEENGGRHPDRGFANQNRGFRRRMGTADEGPGC